MKSELVEERLLLQISWGAREDTKTKKWGRGRDQNWEWVGTTK